MEYDVIVKRMRADLEAMLKESGASLKVSAASIAAYTAERASTLALSIGQPGFSQALKAEKQNVLMFAALQAVDEADEADRRVQVVLETGLRLLTQVAVAAL